MSGDRSIDRIDFQPDHCPECGEWDIVGESVEIDGQVARQVVTCSDCLTSWQDVYRINRRHVYTPVDHTPAELSWTLYVKDGTQ